MIPNFSGILDSLINLVPTTDKLTILPLSQISPIPIPSGLPYVAMFNPENYAITDQHRYDNTQVYGQEGSQQRFISVAPRNLRFDLVIDGTGASGDKRQVNVDIELLRRTVGMSGVIHRPPHLFVLWGNLKAICVLWNMNIKYNLFKSDGTPLRATVTLTLQEVVPRLLSLLEINLTSPDLTHSRIVKEGDKLPYLCYQIYNDSRFYLEVARANGLTNFRTLRPGTKMLFPPVKK